MAQRISQMPGEGGLWVYGKHDRRGEKVRRLELESLEKEDLEPAKRRPCSAIDVSTSLGIDLKSAKRVLGSLKKRGKIGTEKVKEERFYFKG